MEWTELTLINRVDVSQRIDIDPVQLNPLVLKIGGSSQSLAARAGYFLAASTGGKVSEISKRVWRSPRMLKSQVGDFDLLEAITCVARYVSPQERNQPSYVLAHKHSSYHRREIEESKLCGCFYCLEIFHPNEIKNYSWTDEWDGKNQTALCPRCGIDSVIGDASGFPITKEFLRQMKTDWF